MSYVTHCLYAAIGAPVAILTMDMKYFDGTFMGHFPGPKDLVALLVSNGVASSGVMNASGVSGKKRSTTK